MSQTDTPAAEVQDMQSGPGFRDAYYQNLHPVFESNPDLMRLATIVGILLLCFQICVIIWSFRSGRGGVTLLMPLVGGCFLALTLIAPTFTFPLALGILDAIVGFFASIVGG